MLLSACRNLRKNVQKSNNRFQVSFKAIKSQKELSLQLLLHDCNLDRSPLTEVIPKSLPKMFVAEQLYIPKSATLISDSFNVYVDEYLVCICLPVLRLVFPLLHVTIGEGFPRTSHFNSISRPVISATSDWITTCGATVYRKIHDSISFAYCITKLKESPFKEMNQNTSNQI